MDVSVQLPPYFFALGQWQLRAQFQPLKMAVGQPNNGHCSKLAAIAVLLDDADSPLSTAK
jgi:hypothetical protein